MKSAPGGQLAVDEIFGRDQFVASLWEKLDANSVRMEAERRIGKTHILRKMAEEQAPGWEAISLDLEKVHSAAEFAELVYKRVTERLTGWNKHTRRAQGFLSSISEKIGGAQVGLVKFPDKKARPDKYWKNLLISSIEDLVEQQQIEKKRVVFLFDEMPWMIDAISKDDDHGPQTAMEVLDVLRSLRQSSTAGHGFRMVLCGSIGMHHILAELQQKGYRNRPVNDMTLVEVPPLDRPMATTLASLLIAGEQLQSEKGTAEQIAEQTGGFPYYIHWIVSKLRTDGLPVNKANVDAAINWLLTNDKDPCDLRHFLTRIDSYYGTNKKMALAILDHAAKAKTQLSQAGLINVGKSAGATDDDNIRSLLHQLGMDHYLFRNGDGRYSFRHTLLQRWWIIERGID